jgi:UV DNA damage endonuclease
MQRFVDTYKKLSRRVRNRLVLENDDHIFSAEDVLQIHRMTDRELPILFDVFHHECYNTNNMSYRDAFKLVLATWNCVPGRSDGPAMIDYSS